VGVAYARAGRVENAVAVLGRAAERFPDDPAVSAALGRVWLADAIDGDKVALDKALRVLQPAAARASASSDTLSLYGHALLLSGDADAAELVLQQAVTRTPVEPDAYAHLAEAAQRLRHGEIAREAAQRYAALSDANVP
jgi:Flp pilus assembly protein TadD